MEPLVDEQPPPRTLVLFSDFACPLSYLGMVAMERYAKWAIFPVETEYRSFDLYNYIRSPDGDIDWSLDLADEKYFMEVQTSAEILNEQLNLVDKLESPGIIDSFTAHKAAYFVRKEYSESDFKQFHQNILEARWREGRDISQLSVLESVASTVGLSSFDISDAVDNSKIEEEVNTLLRKRQRTRRPISPTTVYQDLSVHGVVPFLNLSDLVMSGKGHPGDEKGARWFRYHRYFSNR